MGNFSSRTLKIPEGIIVSCHSQRYFWLLILRSINTRSLKDDRVICPNFGNSRNPAVDRSFLHQNSQIWEFYGMLSYFDIASAQKMPKIEGKPVKSPEAPPTSSGSVLAGQAEPSETFREDPAMAFGSHGAKRNYW